MRNVYLLHRGILEGNTTAYWDAAAAAAAAQCDLEN